MGTAALSASACRSLGEILILALSGFARGRALHMLGSRTFPRAVKGLDVGGMESMLTSTMHFCVLFVQIWLREKASKSSPVFSSQEAVPHVY